MIKPRFFRFVYWDNAALHRGATPPGKIVPVSGPMPSLTSLASPMNIAAADITDTAAVAIGSLLFMVKAQGATCLDDEEDGPPFNLRRSLRQIFSG